MLYFSAIRSGYNVISFTRDTLVIRGREDSLTACITTSMPQSIRRDLADRLVACFDKDPLRKMDSSSLPEGEGTFDVLHFSWYNCHCTTVSTITFVFVKGIC